MNASAGPRRRSRYRIVLWVWLVAWLPWAAAHAAPEAEPWPRWQAHDAASRATIDHAPWAAFLARYVVKGEDGINRVAYGAVSADDRADLERYIAGLAEVAISRYNRGEQFAYWINLYNALTVRVIVDHYPVASIRDIDISPGWFSDGPWGKKLVIVEGAPLSLDDIEHRILRPVWRDPRIHYAVNCAALGCPNLRARPYRGAAMDDMLDAAARDFINHPRGARVEGGKLRVSSIYHWYESDFGGDDAGVIAHLRRYAETPLIQALEGLSRIDSHGYDWSLNAAGGGTAE